MTSDFHLLWNSLPSPGLMLDRGRRINAVNSAAETFLGASERHLTGRLLDDLAGEDSRIAALTREVARQGAQMVEYDVELTWPERPDRLVDLHASPIHQEPGGMVILIHPRAIAETMDRSLSHRSAARSVAGMSAMLAHEVKNPLAGISGAAQLLEMNAGDEERELAILIREEAERIGALLARVEQFGEIGPPQRRPVNIHDVLDRACRSARAGFASHVRFTERYDPSLPPTFADPDQLMQAIMNLLKNAAEAAPPVGGLIGVRTSYRAGMKVVTPSGRRESLPLEILITDNGAGVPEELQRQIFQPFVSTKDRGSGLGLALVSKIVADHGGVVSCDSVPGNTRFRMLLPIATGESEVPEADAGTAAVGRTEDAA